MKTRKTIKADLETDEKFMTIDGVLYSVVGHRSFDDYGVGTESCMVVNFEGRTRVVHSDDDALTFWEN